MNFNCKCSKQFKEYKTYRFGISSISRQHMSFRMRQLSKHITNMNTSVDMKQNGNKINSVL